MKTYAAQPSIYFYASTAGPDNLPPTPPGFRYCLSTGHRPARSKRTTSLQEALTATPFQERYVLLGDFDAQWWDERGSGLLRGWERASVLDGSRRTSTSRPSSTPSLNCSCHHGKAQCWICFGCGSEDVDEDEDWEQVL